MSRTLGEGQPSPSLFDIGLYLFTFICPIFIWGSWDLNMIQGLFFNFGVLALLGLSFFCKREKEYTSKYLGIFILWSLACVFIHTANSQILGSVVAQWINYCFLSEGFFFVLSACLLYYLIVNYSRNYKIVYPILALNVLNLFFVIVQLLNVDLIWKNITIPCGVFGTPYQLKVFSAMSILILFNHRIRDIWYPFVLIPIFILGVGFFQVGRSMNAMLAIWLVLLLYLYHRRHREFFFVVLGLGLIFALCNCSLIIHKIGYRLKLFATTLKEIIKSPFIGHGFDNSLNNGLILDYENKYAYRQNDYLQIARDLGLPFLGIVVLFLKSILRNAKKDYLWMAIMILIIFSCFQTHAYFVRTGMWIPVLLALKQKEKYV